METHRLTILLTRYPTAVFELLCRVNRCDYLHASLGFAEDMNVFYSFGLKGFRSEHITHSLKPERAPFACALYALDVPEAAYLRAKNIITDFEREKPLLRYTRLGAALAMLRLGCQWKSHYFCSQFVAYVLEKAHAAHLEKDSSLYLAEDLGRLENAREIYRGDALGLAREFRLFSVSQT